jgi:hypothetical protein
LYKLLTNGSSIFFSFHFLLQKLMSFIERVGLRRVGFSCWKIFIVDYFRCYEVINFYFLFLSLSFEIIIRICFSTDNDIIIYAISESFTSFKLTISVSNTIILGIWTLDRKQKTESHIRMLYKVRLR